MTSIQTTYSISDLASEFNVTTRTLRFYEEKGLLKPAREGQTRIYSPADRIRLKLILRGKRLGLSLEESLEIISMYSPDSNNADQLNKLINKINQKREQLVAQRLELDKMLATLDEYENRCQQALTHLTKK